MSMFLGSVGKQMVENEKKDNERVEVRFSRDSPEKTKAVAMKLEQLFNGPIFEKMVRNAVEEMILEGKLTYDIESDTIDVPEDIVKRWAARMESKFWSKNSPSSNK
jgi:hypothetical protein